MLQAYRVSKGIALSEPILEYLKENEDFDVNEPEIQSHATIGGILSSTNLTWYANGPRFVVVNSKNGSKVSAWTFGSVLKDTTTKVVCVAEIPVSNIDLPLLVVGLECALTGGSICIFDLVTSKVLRAIQLKNKVTSVHVINGGDGIFSTLGPLQALDGIIAVGMAGGDIYLMDMCRQSVDDARYSNSTHEIKDELDACQITVLTFKDIEKIELHKQKTAQLGNHLAIHLNAIENNFLPHFILKGPSGEDRIHANKSEVTVSSLHYSSCLGSVLVGYNFGALQMWNIINMKLVYTSPVYEGNIPVLHFAIQEPVDDPRIFCYVWAIYSNTETYQTGFPIAVMYALNFERKEWHDGYGYLYEGFQSCTVRFQTELSFPHHTTCNGRPKGGHCLRLHAFSKGNTNRNSMLESQEDTLTICWAVWNVWCTDRCHHTLVSIFDLNQWYKEQLPAITESNNYKSYMSYVSLSDLVIDYTRDNTPIMDAQINEATINQFIGTQKLEEHYFPCTLAFECITCSEKNIIHIINQGQQRALLTYVETNGPISFLKPTEIYEESMALGLTPLFTELPHIISINFQREQILSIILEQQMIGCLCKCVSTWCNGSHSSAGCSLEFFLSWAWNRAVVLKSNADKLCVPLFDYSRVKLDTNSQMILNNCFKQISNLSIVYDFICTKLSTFLPNAEIVHQQWNCVHLVSVYLEVLHWLLNVGLLPEYHPSMCKEVEQLDSLGAPYPIDTLLDYYNERRACLQTLNREKYSSNDSLLFIDNLINLECGGIQLQKYWEDDGGSGLYPPQSLQALLFIYRVDAADLMYKHSVIFYVFLDLAMTLDQERYKVIISHLIKFPAVFKLSPSIIKITQAFWQLDHGDFETAIELLLDAHIYPGDLKVWHHRIVLNALLAQGQHNFALLYLQVRKPALTEMEDLLKVISLFICNNLLDEVIYYQRHNSTKENELQLLRHMFEECDKNNLLKQLISYGLTQCEEEALMKYLEEINHPNMEEFQMIYYLQQSRYMDIFEMQGNKSSRQLGLVGQKNMNFKEGMIKTLSNFFPTISRNLINVCREERHNLQIKSERPNPLSVVVHDTKEKAKFKSMLMHGIIKARETWSDNYIKGKLSNEDTPFLRTPIATPLRSVSRISIISQKLISPDTSDSDDFGPSPTKKLKLTSRSSFGFAKSHSKSYNTESGDMHRIRLDTPIVTRKIKKSHDFSKYEEKLNIGTPQSILKVLKITPRKNLSRSIVRFEKLSDTLSSSDSPPTEKKHSESSSTLTLSRGSEDIRLSEPNVNASHSTDEIYYSPDSSLNSASISDSSKPKSSEISRSSAGFSNEVSDEITKMIEENKDSMVDLIDDISISLVDSSFALDKSGSDVNESEMQKNSLASPRSRRSYRDESASPANIQKQSINWSPIQSDGIQTRSKSRLSTNIETKSGNQHSSFSDDSFSAKSPKRVSLTPSKIQSPSKLLKARKSLSRQVLEHNAFASMLSSSNTSLSASHTVEKHHINLEKESAEEFKKVSEHSKYITDVSVKIEDSNSQKISLIHTEVQNSSMVKTYETDDDNSVTSDTYNTDTSFCCELPSCILNSPIASPAVNVSSENENNESITDKEVNKTDELLHHQESELITSTGNNEKITNEENELHAQFAESETAEFNNKIIQRINSTDDAAQKEAREVEVSASDIKSDICNTNTDTVMLEIEENHHKMNEVNLEHKVCTADEELPGFNNSDEIVEDVANIQQEVEIITDTSERIIDPDNAEAESGESCSSNPLDRCFYFVDEPDDEEALTDPEEEEENEIEQSHIKQKAEIIEISDSSAESSTDKESGSSKTSSHSYTSEEVNEESEGESSFNDELEKNIEEEDAHQSDYDINDEVEQFEEQEKYDINDEVEQFEEQEKYYINDEVEKLETQEKYDINDDVEESKEREENVECEEIPIDVNDLNDSEVEVEAKNLNQEQTVGNISNMDAIKCEEENIVASNTAKTIDINKTDIPDSHCSNEHVVEVTGVNLYESVGQEIEIADELSNEIEMKESADEDIAKSEATVNKEDIDTSVTTKKDGVNKTDILGVDKTRQVLEITGVDILDKSVEPSVDIMSATRESSVLEPIETSISSRLRRRASSCDTKPTTSSPVLLKTGRKRSASIDQDPKLAASVLKEIAKKSPTEKEILIKPKRRLRSTSSLDNDEVVLGATSSRSRRATSVCSYLEDSEIKPVRKSRNQRSTSIHCLSIINENEAIQEEVETAHEPPTNLFEEYSTSRRLTRHQKSLLEKSKHAVSSSLGDLDSPVFDSVKTDDEMGTEKSSQTCTTEDSIGEKLRRRRQSYDSASSVASSAAVSTSDVGTPKKKSRTRKYSTESDRQLRSSDSKASHKSIENLVTEDTVEISPGPRRSTRTRLRSKTPENSSDAESSASVKIARRRLISTESDLPQIPEEESSDIAEKDEKSTAKTGRKRKSSTRT